MHNLPPPYSPKKEDGDRPPTPGPSRTGETDWAEGLRGLAAVGVVASHLSLSFGLDYIRPCDGGPGGPSRLFQLPILRLFVQGEAFVALFFILTGFVNSLKPLKQSQANDIEGALVSLARSSLTRIPRLIMPAAAVTVITWFACQFGVFEIARHSNAYWLRVNSRAPSSSWFQAVVDLFKALADTWLAENPYDQPQWALPYLLKGSVYIFVTLLIIVTTRSAFRITIIALAFAWSYLALDSLVGMNVFVGMFLAEVHTTKILPEIDARLRFLPFLTALSGLYFMSFPSSFADWSPWSRDLNALGLMIFGQGRGDVGRFWTATGAQILCFSIQISPELRRAFSGRYLMWLGSISFSMYLLHGPLMRSVLAWMAFGPNWLFGAELVDAQIPQPANVTLLVTFPMFAALLLAASSLWTVKVEPYFARATKYIQSVAARDTGGPVILK